MKILDRYISKKFLGALLFTLIAFISLFIVIDLIDRLGDFLNHNVPKSVIIEYYLYYIPFIIVLILPVGMLLSSLFSIGNLARYSELIAMKASGLSLQRILLPILGIGFLISLLMIYFGEKVVPFTNQKMYNIERVFLHKHTPLSQRRSNIIFKDNEYDRWIYIGYYDHRIKKAYNVSIQKIANQSIVQRFDAKRMVWKDSSWVLEDWYERSNTGMNTGFKNSDSSKKVSISFSPDDFSEVQKKHEEMSYHELQEFIDEVAKNGGEPKTWLVDLYLKISFPFSNFIIVLFGAPLAGIHNRGGFAFGIAISLFVSFFFFGLIKTGQTLGHNGILHPMPAAWLGNIVFFLAGILIMIKVRK